MPPDHEDEATDLASLRGGAGSQRHLRQQRRGWFGIRLERDVFVSLLIGAVLAALLWFIPLGHATVGMFVTLVHELGHSATAWAFGYPAIPAIDFTYGGGFAHTFARSNAVLGVVLLLWATLFSRVYKHVIALPICLVAFALWCAAAYIEPVHMGLISFMGHGGEFLIAGIFLARGISGVMEEARADRPVYVALGLLLPLMGMELSWKLATDSGFRSVFLDDFKGGAILDDMSVIAGDYLHIPMPRVAFLFFLASLTPYILGTLVGLLQVHLLNSHDDD